MTKRRTKAARARELAELGTFTPSEIAERLKMSRQAVHAALQHEDKPKARKGVERLQVAVDEKLLGRARALAEHDGIPLGQVIEKALEAWLKAGGWL